MINIAITKHSMEFLKFIWMFEGWETEKRKFNGTGLSSVASTMSEGWDKSRFKISHVAHRMLRTNNRM